MFKLFVFLIGLAIANAVCPAGDQTYTVKSGDTCISIAAANNANLANIESANPAINAQCTNLAIGQILCIPPVTCPAGQVAYPVKTGDSCNSIATQYSTTAASVENTNTAATVNSCTALQPGEVLCIAPGTVCPAGSQQYTVVAGDTCNIIAGKTLANVANIQAANPAINAPCTNLQPGQILCIPPVSCPAGQTMYTVPAGGNCNTIQTATGVSVASIEAANSVTTVNACTQLAVGEVLCLPAPTCPAGEILYTVVAGDTCISIAAKEGTTVANVESANPAINAACTNLAVGQALCIPPPSCPVGQTMYTVPAGATCTSIQTATGVSVANIENANPAATVNGCTQLAAGEVLCLPPACPVGEFPYTVVNGDTCLGIAAKEGTTLANVQGPNPAINNACSNLLVGQIICIAPPSCPAGQSAYTIPNGATCNSIAMATGTSIAQVMASNPAAINAGCTNLLVGEVICLPPATCPLGQELYTVVAGDTCTAIGTKTGTNSATVIANNPAINPWCGNLFVGQNLCV